MPSTPLDLAAIEGMTREYNLYFDNFTRYDCMDVEEYLVIFSGYQHHRPIDTSRRHCEYWYQSTISSAKLNQNIHRMLEQLDIKANVQFQSNTLRVDQM